jgi:hypothetical protein
MVLAVSRDLWSEWNKDLGTRLVRGLKSGKMEINHAGNYH